MPLTSLTTSTSYTTEPTAVMLLLGGRVQGVGYRPFVYRLAQHHGLLGWVKNELGQVRIFVQGDAETINAFIHDLLHDSPGLAEPHLLQQSKQSVQALTEFTIQASASSGNPHIHVPPDYSPCPECLTELFDPADRRGRYPFINCTQCGPRYSLIEQLPYDRANTSMRDFILCPQCAKEYHNPLDRRFHAEPTACPVCGPRLQFRSSDNAALTETESALNACVQALHAGQIVAIKGVGGYHLFCDAHNDAAILRLRQRKPRPTKPLAVMFPVAVDDLLHHAKQEVIINPAAARQLIHPMRPIVLCPQRAPSSLSPHIAPGLNEIGTLLPYSPLHYLLLHEFGAPLIATSANLSGEPVLTDALQVEQRLAHVADAFLHHDRPIVRPADDSVYRIIARQARPLRLGRGLAPLELTLDKELPQSLIAVGGHMKNTVALAWDRRVVISPHIGDLDTPRSIAVFEQIIAELQQLYRVQASTIICDAHRGYASHRWAQKQGLTVVPIWHHHAHASAVAGEFPRPGNWLVFTWDGTGLGPDGSLWGAEALFGQAGFWRRVASLRPFRLPGGDKAGREPWRSAAALCWETGIAWPGASTDTDLAHQAWQKSINSPQTSAAGRLFDAAASLLGIGNNVNYEGEAPMRLEALCSNFQEAAPLPLSQSHDGLLIGDWEPLLSSLMDTRLSVTTRAEHFHATLAATIVEQARHARRQFGEFAVGLCGGVFQNRHLTEQTLTLLQQAGFETYLPTALPVNDGGLCYGQVIEAAAQPW